MPGLQTGKLQKNSMLPSKVVPSENLDLDADLQTLIKLVITAIELARL